MVVGPGTRRTGHSVRGSGRGAWRPVGYRGPTACAAAGSPTGSWTTGRARARRAVVRVAPRVGSQRLYSFRDILVLKVVKRLLDTGVSLQNIRSAVETCARGRRRSGPDHVDLRRHDGLRVHLVRRGRRSAPGWPGRLRDRRSAARCVNWSARSPSCPANAPMAGGDAGEPSRDQTSCPATAAAHRDRVAPPQAHRALPVTQRP